MSYTYHQLHKQVFAADQSTLSDIFDRLAASNPALLKKYAHIDWAALRKALAKKALEMMAQQMKGTLSQTFQRSGRRMQGTMPTGECLGVVTKNHVQVGLFMEDGKIQLHWSEMREDGRTIRSTTAMRNKLEEIYKDQLIQAAVQLTTGNKPVRIEGQDGAIHYEAQIKEVQ